jgi:hypothetical protein
MTVYDELQALYDELPTVACKGLCWNSCGPIDMSDAERSRIVDLGVEIQVFTPERAAAWAADAKGELYCSALSFNAHEGGMGCTVYEARPLICRLWGVGVGDLACPYGCEVTGRLDNAEANRFIMRSMKIGGRAEFGDMEAAEQMMDALMADPEHRVLMERFMAGDKSVLPRLQTSIENYHRSRA